MKLIPKLIPNPLKTAQTIVSCQNCQGQYPVPLFGWTHKSCHVCQTLIPHPSSQITGYKAHGAKSKAVTVRIPAHLVDDLDQLAKEHQSSRGGIIKLCIEIILNAERELGIWDAN